MRALSFLQPWAFGVTDLGKRIDNRRMKSGRMPPVCKHRGPMLIHASIGKGPRTEHGQAYVDWAIEWMNERGLWKAHDKPSSVFPVHVPLQRGGIVGRCSVIGHFTPDGRFWLDPGGTETDEEISATFDRRWHMAGSYGLALADVEALPFVPCKGALGLWTVPDDVNERVEKARAA